MLRIESIVILLCFFSFTALLSCSEKSEDPSSEDSLNNSETMADSELTLIFITENDEPNQHWESSSADSSRVRKVTITPSFIDSDPSDEGNLFSLNIYQNENLSVTISRVSTDSNQIKSITGSISEDKGNFIFSVSDNILTGQIYLTDRNKIIEVRKSEDSGYYTLTERLRSELDVLPGSRPLRPNRD
ncbi:MAG: hypothetical protein EA360_02120 [Balneolaceae bacterium]|nr:MAG: hypothetical protein EA360_02120 [Balneolaceae bacterium]